MKGLKQFGEFFVKRRYSIAKFETLENVFAFSHWGPGRVLNQIKNKSEISCYCIFFIKDSTNQPNNSQSLYSKY